MLQWCWSTLELCIISRAALKDCHMNNAIAHNQPVNTVQLGWLTNWVAILSCHHRSRHILVLPLNCSSSQHYINVLSLIHLQINTLSLSALMDVLVMFKSEKWRALWVLFMHSFPFPKTHMDHSFIHSFYFQCASAQMIAPPICAHITPTQ